MDITEYNRMSWNNQVDSGDQWTQPVDSATIAQARADKWHIVLTPTRPVPRNWFPPNLKDKKVLCLASGGGQQGPILAAAGAKVTVLDNSDKQLDQDRFVAKREQLDIETIKGSMTNLSMLADETFDIIIHPVSNVFIDNVLPVWQEAYRVLKTGGSLLAGFTNPILFLFAEEAVEKGPLEVKYPIPYSDLKHLPSEKLAELQQKKEPLAFGHTLEDQIKGQLDAGFVLSGFYEDQSGYDSQLDSYISVYIATQARKLG
ncbi:class I SAM-dependent methyltransferase [Hazenella sp. IB182353]|uniref:class I SAM-dependent methyltransferase n=1 Tax=Polycladospora coralii TaxID=2771432 RepID=UPI001746879A|nr:class I SAM-dependent methyltransferase [Polycladospora coralii]MBS7529477.1 class I SAM-dependent methyltransferase [Polycladospora coralii]